MKIAVCIKQVPATDTRLKIGASGVSIDYADVTMVLNPYDEIAVEAALKLKEAHGGETVVVTLGPDKALEALRTSLAMGIDKAIHVTTGEVTGADSFMTARALAAVLKREPYDVILFGKQAVDDDNGAVGIQVAECLGFPHVSMVTRIQMSADGKQGIFDREIEGGVEVVECSLPIVLTAQKGLNEPRYPSLPGIMKAKSKPMEKIDGAAFLGENSISWEEVILPPIRKAGQLFQGDSPSSVETIVKYLREELKVL